MPDDDRIPRFLSGPWRKVLRCLQGREPVERTEDVVTTALAATLRSVRGVPQLAGIAAQMQEAAAADTVPGSRVPDSAAARWHVPTGMAERAAAVLVARLKKELSLVSPDRAATLLAERLLHDLAFHFGLDRMAPLLIADGTYEPAELQTLLAQIFGSDRISTLAKRLVARPDAAGLRAPPQRRSKRPLAELLDTDLAEV